MKHILFVDDQAELLEGLKRLFRPRRASWQMYFANSGAEALEIIGRESIDVIVSDMRMPVMDGAELLNEVLQRSPHTARIMLSGQADQDQILRAVGLVHQFLSKPCTPQLLASTIERACALRDLFSAPSIREFASNVTKLPSLPRVFQQLIETLRTPDVGVNDVAKLISQDLAISCRVLHLVNSGFFGLPCRVESVTHAASLLGLDRLRALMLCAGIFTQFQGQLPPQFSLDDLMERSMATSAAAQRLAQLERPKDVDLRNEVMLAGIVLDIGHLILLQNRSDEYTPLLIEADRDGIPLWEAENQKFQASHASLGAYLLGLWGFSDVVVEAVALHHTPGDAAEREFGALAVVHVADALVQELQPANRWPFGAVLDEAYVQEIGASDRLNVWREKIQSLTPKVTA